MMGGKKQDLLGSKGGGGMGTGTLFPLKVHYGAKRRGGTTTMSGSAGPNSNQGFLVRHYAGEVAYSTHGWLEKNNDRSLPEIEALLQGSTVPLVQRLMLAGEEG